MSGQTQHAMLPDASHDEGARQEFSVTLAGHVARNVQGGTRKIYDTKVEPAFRRKQNRKPNRLEVRRALLEEPYYQMWSSLKRTTQEILFDSVGESVERQLPALIKRAKPSGRRKGSLTLDPAVKVPTYLSAVDIHCMPGNYHGEIAADDVYAGALFDRGIYLYGLGGLGPDNDDMGRSISHWLKRNHPGFKPKRILDMGCSAGTNTVAWTRTYPGAAVHAIDVAAPMLRYAHARAEAYGAPIHFSQQNAEKTNFPSGHFDLVYSHILTHETATTAYHNIIRECFRLLKPGGLMIHQETQWATKDEPFNQATLDWETHYNAEPFKTKLDTLNLQAIAEQAGFKAKNVFFQTVPSEQAGTKYYRGQWNLFGAWKK